MLEYIAQHPYVGVILILLILLTVFVWGKAISSGKKRNLEREKIIADLEKEKALRNEFRHLDELTFVEGKDNYRLILGICANIQMSLEKKPDMTAAFNDLSKTKQYIYALGYVFEDSADSLSEFFRSNGEPLLSTANNAVRDIISGEFSEIFESAFNMFDENNEDVSVIESDVQAIDKRYSELMETESVAIYEKAADYIRSNKYEFLN